MRMTQTELMMKTKTMDDGTHQHNSSTFEEAMTANIDVILDIAAGLKHQLQFWDQRVLNAFQREGAEVNKQCNGCRAKHMRLPNLTFSLKSYGFQSGAHISKKAP